MMSKKTFDTVGGAGSIAVGLMCVWLAMRHNDQEQMHTVWLVMSVLLVLNGLLMLVHARRQGGLPAVAQELLRHDAVKPLGSKAGS